MLSEVTIVIKDEERTYRKKHLIYDLYQVDEHDPILAECIRETEKEFNGDPTDIQIKISMVVR